MQIRRFETRDWSEWVRMSRALFPALSDADKLEMQATLARPDAAVFVLERDEGSLAGFVEVGTRSIADGCETSPVGYIEAWYVDADVRRKGYGKLLLEAAESWSALRGYREMGSDALLDYQVSHSAHKAAGYEEVDKVIVYRKTIQQPVTPANARQAVPFFRVADITRSLAFYVDGLGLKKTREWVVEGKLKWCWLELGDAALMLQEIETEDTRRTAADAPKGVGVAINFIAMDAIAVYRGLQSRNIEASRPFVGNGMWVTRVTDPDGYELYFESPTDAPEEKELDE
ncbi:MAG TPA: GNAT family N-acetyltransferase [Gemmatimonadaceae bacterium]|nr:GNAT family N-acetyltransferase [Gemmatimonadaceae bacterium]